MEAMTMKEAIAWGVWVSCAVAATVAGYINGGWTGALSAYAATGAISAAVLANQARTGGTNGTSRP